MMAAIVVANHGISPNPLHHATMTVADSSPLHPINIFYIGSVAALAGFLFGFDTGVIAGAEPFINKTFSIDTADARGGALEGFIVGAVPLGALFGSMLSGWLSQWLGRRKSLMVTALLFIVGTLGAAFAPAVSILIGARLLMGVAIGVSAMITPMYLGEVAPARVRGTIIFMFQLAITLGLLVSFGINLLMAEAISDHNLAWRVMFAVGLIPAVGLFIGMLRLPCSPRWLVMKGRVAEARHVMRSLLGKHEIDEEMEEIHTSVSQPTGGLRDLCSRRILPLLAVAIFLMVFQQLSGINAIMYYGPEVFGAAGFGETARNVAQLVMGAVNVGLTVLGMWLIDRLGRRLLLSIGFIGMITCLVLVAVLLYAIPGGAGTYLIFAAILGFIGFFAVSLGGVPWVMIAELFPFRVRATGMAIAVMANWAIDWVVSQTFPMLRAGFGMDATFAIYAFCTFIGFFFVMRYVPETKDRTLEQIERNLDAGKSLRHLGD